MSFMSFMYSENFKIHFVGSSYDNPFVRTNHYQVPSRIPLEKTLTRLMEGITVNVGIRISPTMLHHYCLLVHQKSLMHSIKIRMSSPFSFYNHLFLRSHPRQRLKEPLGDPPSRTDEHKDGEGRMGMWGCQLASALGQDVRYIWSTTLYCRHVVCYVMSCHVMSCHVMSWYVCM